MDGLGTWAIGLVVAILGSGGISYIVNAIANRRVVRVDAVDRLSDSALKWVEQFQEQATAAQVEAARAWAVVNQIRQECAETRREVTDARTQLRAVRDEAELLSREIQHIRRLVTEPGMTINRLRDALGVDPKINGHDTVGS